MVIWPLVLVDLSGMGLQPPRWPMEAALRGEAHILQVMPSDADVEAYGAADLAGVGYGDDVAVGLLEEEEADFDDAAFAVVDVDAVAVELVVVDVGGGEGDLASRRG